MSTRQKALDALADIEHQASGGLEIDSALFRTVRAALSAPAEQDGWIDEVMAQAQVAFGASVLTDELAGNG